MDRHSLTATQWVKIQPLCLGKKSDPGGTARDTRLFLEAILWIAKREPMARLARLRSLEHSLKRFRHWVKVDVFKRII